ncbi:type II secretion system minor pseudopilin GspI [Hyphomonas chukchiensis]|uniref:type II secretion system minor pseudopilin GspI n=1 Tax=Hyphomonas chukchiensis TaxID=1280947 RepID=UPI00054D66E7|nr:type II secretion system minor pseudopilin GspI [Hyphomonas chukchiensis]
MRYRLSPAPVDVPANAGFSLIEVLIALTVLSIAGGAFIRVAQNHIETVDRLEVRMISDIVAQNTLVELRLDPSRITAAPSLVHMADRSWRVTVKSKGSSDPDLAEVSISVSEDGGTGAASLLDAFVDTAGPS